MKKNNLNGLKTYWSSLPNALFYKWEVSFIGLRGSYKFLTNINSSTDSSGLKLAADHSANIGQRGAMIQDPNNGLAMLLPWKTNRYKDVAYRTDRTKNYLFYIKQKNQSSFLIFREENLTRRITNDAFLCTLLAETNNSLSDAKQIVDFLYQTLAVDNAENFIPWLKTTGLDKHPEFSVPTYEMLKGMDRLQIEFNKIDYPIFLVSSAQLSIDNLINFFKIFSETLVEFIDFKSEICRLITYTGESNPTKDNTKFLLAYIEVEFNLFKNAYTTLKHKLDIALKDRILRNFAFSQTTYKDLSRYLNTIDTSFSNSLHPKTSLSQDFAKKSSNDLTNAFNDYVMSLDTKAKYLSLNFDIPSPGHMLSISQSLE